MRGRYFPDTDFMQANVPHSASAIWRAIVAGQEALSMGLVQRVGGGTTINAWTDKWIHTTAPRTPMLRPPNTNVEWVSDLIDTANWTWKRELVRETFITPDVEAILNISLRRGRGADFLAWAHEKLGNYSVKTAY